MAVGQIISLPAIGYIWWAGDSTMMSIVFTVYLLVAVLLVWPVFPLFSGVRPLILGLPLSLAWVVLALGVMFAALVWLYRNEDRD